MIKGTYVRASQEAKSSGIIIPKGAEFIGLNPKDKSISKVEVTSKSGKKRIEYYGTAYLEADI